MTENREGKDYFNKKNVFTFFKKFGMTLLVISPILIFFLCIMGFQLTYLDEKDPFVQWSGYDPRTEAVITWETKDIIESTVWYGTDEDDLNIKVEEDSKHRIHKVLLENLTSNKKYYYQVNIDNSKKSDIFSFKTAPNDTTTDFKFIAYSDTQQYYGVGWHKRICDAIATHNDISFVTIVGDLCNEWDYKPDWNMFFHDTHTYMKRLPFVPCMGNHDGFYPDDDPKGTKHWYKNYFGSPYGNNTFYYSFNWSNTLFAVCEVSKGEDENPNLARNILHDEWLNKTLAYGQDKAFRIIWFHRQLFSAEDDNDGLIDRMLPIFDKYNVSLVLYGHHHHYERLLYKDRTYICLGGGGGQQFGSNFFFPGENTKSFAMGPSYTKFSIKEESIEGITYSAENDRIDAFKLKLKGAEAILEE